MDLQSHKASSGRYVIVAELRMSSTAKFEEAVKSLGKAVRLNDTVWLLEADGTLASVRNYLQTLLAAADMMFIVDVGTGRRAWNNVGIGVESQLRTLWQGSSTLSGGKT